MTALDQFLDNRSLAQLSQLDTEVTARVEALEAADPHDDGPAWHFASSVLTDLAVAQYATAEKLARTHKTVEALEEAVRAHNARRIDTLLCRRYGSAAMSGRRAPKPAIRKSKARR